MGRLCKICCHPKVVEINQHLIKRDLTLKQIQEKYGRGDHPFSISALQRHWINHVKPEVEKAQRKMQRQIKSDAEKQYIDDLEALNRIISQLDELLAEGRISLTHILKAIQLRMQLLGETAAPPEIVIRWGLGLKQDEAQEEQAIEEEEVIKKREEVLKLIV